VIRLWSQSFTMYSSWNTCLAAFVRAKTAVLSCVPISIASLLKFLSFKCFFYWHIEVQGASKFLVFSKHSRQVELCNLWDPSLCVTPGGGLSLFAELWIWLLHLWWEVRGKWTTWKVDIMSFWKSHLPFPVVIGGYSDSRYDAWKSRICLKDPIINAPAVMRSTRASGAS
jgi:hypothetical protein